MTGKRSSKGKSLRRSVAISAALMILGGLATADTQAQPRLGENENLRIASWNLSDAAATGVIVREKPVAKSWRNTFGNERRIAAKPKFAGDRLQADVVLLQGISSIREVRQIFPARDWKLILSRQVLQLGGGRLNQETAVSGQHTITAVAMRYQLRLRMTALEHLDKLEDAVPAPGAGSGVQGEPVPDALALRLAYSGSVIWVVSAVLPARCRTSKEPCEPAARIKHWADAKRADGFHVVMGGQLNDTLRQAGPNGICADQEIVADQTLKAETGADTVAGCIAFADIGSR